MIEFLKFLLKLGMMVFVVWIICNIGEGRWGKPDFSKKDSFLQFVEKLASWLYGIIDYYAINYPIPYLIFRWTFIISFISFVILGLAFMIFELYRSFKLVKKREWRKLIDEQGDSYALFVGGAIGYFLFRWVWGEDYPWFGLSQFGVPLPLAGGIGAAVLFIGIKQFIGDWVPAFAPSPKREPEEDDPLPLPDAISLEGPQAEDVGSNDPTTQEAKHDTKQKGVIDNDGRRNSWGTNVEVRVMVMARTIAIWIFGLLASAIIGGLVGSRLEPTYSDGWGFWGVLAGMLTFACLRLWLAAPSKTKIDPP